MTSRTTGSRWVNAVDDLVLLAVITLVIPLVIVIAGAPLALIAWLATVLGGN